MTAYDKALAAERKELFVVWDFIGAELTTKARFQTRLRVPADRDTDDDIPTGFIQFAGAIAGTGSGSGLDVTTGGLSIGEARFVCGNVLASDGTRLVEWLAQNDRFLNGIAVERRQGFRTVPTVEEWKLTTWALENYRMTNDGGFEFVLVNIIGKITAGLYEAFEAERYELPIGGATILTTDTTITLDTSPKNIWREPGLAILYNEDALFTELIEYQTIGGTGNKDLQTVTRNKFGVGHPLRVFPNPGTSIYHAWAKRGNPISVLLEWLMTTGYVSESATQRISNATLDAWTTSTDCDDWEEIKFGSATIVEETVIVHTGGGSSAKIGADGGAWSMGTDVNFSLDANKGAILEFWVYVESDPSVSSVEFFTLIRNNTAAGTPKWDGVEEEWTTGSSLNKHTVKRFDQWVRCFIGLDTIDPTFSDTDDYEVTISGLQQSNVVAYLDDVSFTNPYSAKPNGIHDLGGGDGLGLVKAQIDVRTFEDIRDEFLPEPTFDVTTGNRLTGTAVLFVGRDPIDDIKVFVEQAIFRAFALYPIMDETERLACELYFRVSTALVNIDDEWDKSVFRPSSWKRNFLARINNLSLESDWNTEEGEYGRKKQILQAASVARFGKSKLIKITSPGGRNNLWGYPDYNSAADLATAANRIMLDLANPSVDLSIRAFYKHKDVGLTKLVRLNIPGVIDLGMQKIGMVGNFLMVTQRKVNDRDGHVLLSVRERRPVIRPAIVAPDTVNDSYTAADDVDRQFCYLAPLDDAEFANGDPAYTVVA